MGKCDAESARRAVEWSMTLGAIELEAVTELLFPRGVPEWIGSRNPEDFNP